jgi:hypothetical protein
MFLLQAARSLSAQISFYLEILIFMAGLNAASPFTLSRAVSHPISDDQRVKAKS